MYIGGAKGERLSMMLQEGLRSGTIGSSVAPEARRLLSKLQKGLTGSSHSIDASDRELGILLELYNDYMEDYSMAPFEESRKRPGGRVFGGHELLVERQPSYRGYPQVEDILPPEQEISSFGSKIGQWTAGGGK